MTVRIRFEAEVRIGPTGEEAAAPQLLPLLDAIRQWGSLAKAARVVGCSYRHAWGLIGKCKDVLGHALATLERGRGARLTPLGERLLWAHQQTRERLGPVLAELAAELEGELARARRTKARQGDGKRRRVRADTIIAPPY